MPIQFIRVTKKFTFDMAHALEGYDGPCKNIHGHTYRLWITIKGPLLSGGPKDGMVMDFSDLKSTVRELIIDQYDHALLLNKNSAYQGLHDLAGHFEKVRLVNFQPTCENILLQIVNEMKLHLPPAVVLQKVRLSETPTSFAEWLVEDNR